MSEMNGGRGERVEADRRSGVVNKALWSVSLLLRPVTANKTLEAGSKEQTVSEGASKRAINRNLVYEKPVSKETLTK